MKRSAAGCLVVGALLATSCGETHPSDPSAVVIPVFALVSDNFQTHATGGEEVPPNASKAQGQAVFKLNQDGTLSYRLNVANIENVLQAHIHMAPAGSAGGIVAWLYPSAPPAVLIPGRVQGTLATGTITDSDVVGALAGQGVAGLLQAIRAGNTYANVHTSQFPPGEIRGQID